MASKPPKKPAANKSRRSAGILKTGDVVYRLTVRQQLRIDGRVWYRCRCTCGTILNIRGADLVRQDSRSVKSCGCFHKEQAAAGNTTHGMARSPTHRCWMHMLERCSNKNNKDYHHYGGRGIRVCKRWLKFENFFADMGLRPPKTSIDRKDNSKGYYPGNCRWATQSEQMLNTRANLLITLGDKTLPALLWVPIVKLPYSTIINRKFHGWSDIEALTVPYRTRRGNR